MARSSAAADAARAAPLFAALGDETRLRIVRRLCAEGPLSITALTDGARISRQAITKHLNALAGAGLVSGERSGRASVWQLEARRLDDVRKYLDEISRQWDAAVERLRAMVEGESG
jgi:DNA-binding transcriptional ArsR family regulator